jgi:hypothetical protein
MDPSRQVMPYSLGVHAFTPLIFTPLVGKHPWSDASSNVLAVAGTVHAPPFDS